jgi:hypothetical protein
MITRIIIPILLVSYSRKIFNKLKQLKEEPVNFARQLQKILSENLSA